MPITRKFRRSGAISRYHDYYILDQSFYSKEKEKEIQYPIEEKEKVYMRLKKVSKQFFQKLISLI